MRVKFLAFIILSMLLMIPAASASMGLMPPQAPTMKMPAFYAPQAPRITTYYGGQNNSDLSAFADFISNLVNVSDEEIASHGNGTKIAAMLKDPVPDLQLNAIQDPMDFLAALAPPITSSMADTANKNNINKTLVGMNLTYSSIAGKPMNYTITANDIKDIQRTMYNGKPAWKVRVGKGLAWDLIMDNSGQKILETDQLFQT